MDAFISSVSCRGVESSLAVAPAQVVRSANANALSHPLATLMSAGLPSRNECLNELLVVNRRVEQVVQRRELPGTMSARAKPIKDWR
jgi:hypothetical protein